MTGRHRPCGWNHPACLVRCGHAVTALFGACPLVGELLVAPAPLPVWLLSGALHHRLT